MQLILGCFTDSKLCFWRQSIKWFYFCVFTAGQCWWTSGSGAKRTGRQAVSCRGKCSGMLILVIPVKFCHLFIAVQFSLSFNFLCLEIFWEQSFCGRMTTAVCSITICPLIPSPNLSSHSFGLLKSLWNGSVKGQLLLIHILWQDNFWPLAEASKRSCNHDIFFTHYCRHWWCLQRLKRHHRCWCSCLYIVLQSTWLIGNPSRYAYLSNHFRSILQIKLLVEKLLIR